MLIGRSKEQARLRGAILVRRSILVCGPAGSGKTALLEETLATLPAVIREHSLVCKTDGPPRQLWQSLTRRLAELHDGEVISRIEQETGPTAPLDRWLRGQTSLRLRGILRRAMHATAYWVFLEAAARLPDGVYRLFQEWVWSGRTPLVLLARGSTEQDLGKVARLYWHPGLRLELAPMPAEDLADLLEFSIARFHLSDLADAEFRSFILEQSAGLPGRIVRLCELASSRAYQFGGRVKLHTLALDFLLQDKTVSAALTRASHDG
jgi:AAA ATPase-like protein